MVPQFHSLVSCVHKYKCIESSTAYLHKLVLDSECLKTSGQQSGLTFQLPSMRLKFNMPSISKASISRDHSHLQLDLLYPFLSPARFRELTATNFYYITQLNYKQIRKTLRLLHCINTPKRWKYTASVRFSCGDKLIKSADDKCYISKCFIQGRPPTQPRHPSARHLSSVTHTETTTFPWVCLSSSCWIPLQNVVYRPPWKNFRSFTDFSVSSSWCL